MRLIVIIISVMQVIFIHKEPLREVQPAMVSMLEVRVRIQTMVYTVRHQGAPQTGQGTLHQGMFIQVMICT